jgi:hypothetical protein
VHPGGEPLVRGDARQQIAELPPLLLVERGEERLPMLARHASDVGERRLAARREMQRIRAAVLRDGAPLQEIALLEVVDERDEARREDAEPLAERALREARREADEAQDAGVLWTEPQRREALREAARRVRAHLRQQECRGTRAAGTSVACPATSTTLAQTLHA